METDVEHGRVVVGPVVMDYERDDEKPWADIGISFVVDDTDWEMTARQARILAEALNHATRSWV